MARRAPEVRVREDQHRALVALTRRRSTAQALAMRARIELACATGAESKQVAAELGVDQATVGKWRRRFPGFKVGGSWRFDRQEISNWIKRQMEGQRGGSQK